MLQWAGVWAGVAAIVVGLIIWVYVSFFAGFGWLPHAAAVIPGFVTGGIIIGVGVVLLVVGWTMRKPSPLR